MSNDLISRSALMQSLRGNVLVDVTPHLEEAIKEQPAAYDVDKVIEQLNKVKYEGELYPASLAVEIKTAERIVRSGGKTKYRCIKELWIQKCDGDGAEIPNEYGCVEAGSEWQEDIETSICGGEIHLDKIFGKTSLTWIEIDWETLKEAFEAMDE